MLYAIVLICSLNVSHQDCQLTNAKRYVRVPGGNELPMMCMLRAQEYAAQENLDVKSDEYPKVVCTKHDFGGKVG